MPRGRASRQVESDSDSDSGDAPSQSQRFQASQRSQSQADPDVNAKRIATFVSDTVSYILIANIKKSTLKRTDIIKHAMKDSNKDFQTVIKAAKKKLIEVFGIELRELPDNKGQFILLNKLDVNADNPHIVWSDKENSRISLLSLILAMIYMNGNKVAESVLWPTLNKLGIDIEVPHREFEDVRKLVTRDFVRQKYLEYSRIPNSDPAIFEFCWGPRAYLETNKMDILNIVCEVYGNGVKPVDFMEQYAEASQKDSTQ